MALKYPPFAACSDMEKAAKSSPPLRSGSKGTAVRLLQGGLIQLGFPLPISTKHGVPDGKYGGETAAAVRKYQTKNGLVPDGSAGKNTIAKMDAQLAATSKPGPSPLPVPPSPSTHDYKLGNSDPPLGHDPGAGVWNSKPKEAAYLAFGVLIVDSLPLAYAVIGDDATKHMFHYLGNSGRTYTIDLEGMVNEVPSAKERYEDELAQAKEFVEKLGPGRHEITSKQGQDGYNMQSENRNWFFAIGGYTSWGKGVAVVKQEGNATAYDLDFEYKFYDRYNWDTGKKVTFAGITVTDKTMGELHRQGLAHEFDCVGSFKRRVTWRK